jgi:hypothetical protein
MKMNQQQEQQHTISIKATFVPTDENRAVALQAPLSYTLLVDKLASLFAINSASDVRVHYIDDESDRVAISSSEELACALSLTPAGRALRLFVSADTASAAAKDKTVPAVETAAIDALKGQLQAAGVEIGPAGAAIDEKKCQRVLVRSRGDVAKASKAIRRMHERSLRQPGDHAARQAQREARKSERLAARLARQERHKHKKHATYANDNTNIDCNTNCNGSDQSQRKTKPAPEPATIANSLMNSTSCQRHDEGTASIAVGHIEERTVKGNVYWGW